MENSLIPFASLSLALALLASSAVAHEDDPKILDQKAPTTSQGFRRSVPGSLQANNPGGPIQTFQMGSFASSGVQLLSWVPLNLIDGASGANDCWGYVSPTGKEIAILCTRSGTAFFDIDNPGNPIQIGYVDGPNSTWRDVKVYASYAYIVSEAGDGIQVVDLAQVDTGTITQLPDVLTGGGTSTHNVAIDEDSGFLYRSGGGSNGLRIYDLNISKTNPPFVGSWSTKYVHDVQIVTYTTGPYAGKQVAFCCSGFNGGGTQTGLSIVDVTNKSNPIVMSEAFYQDPAYSHQGWLSEDRTRFYLGDELDEDGSLTTRTHVINVTDLNNPVVEGFFTNGNTAIGHNMYAKDGLLYQANYTSGMRVFDYAANPTNPTEVAFFDTFSAGDGDTFNGLWSLFPYFPSGVVIGSDIEGGLFVWYTGPAQLEVQVVGGAPELWNPNGLTLQITIDEASAGLLLAGSPALVYDAGAGPISLALNSLGGNLYDVTLPSLPCGSQVSWYVNATSTTGLDWSAPQNAPAEAYNSTVALGLTLVANDELETLNPGWVAGVPSDDATTGMWTWGNPNGSGAQSEDDHTANGVNCFFTGQANAGAGIGSNDVDNGTTTLMSPIFDLSGNPTATIEYWRWYVNDGNNSVTDSFVVDISSDGGNTWTNLETVGPGNSQASGGWFLHTATVADFVTPTNQVRLRFLASDLGSGSIVEAAIDDLRIAAANCSGTQSNFCSPASTNSTGLAGVLDAVGSVVALDNNLTLQAQQLPPGQFGYFITGTAQMGGITPPGSNGMLCLGGSLGRFNRPGEFGSTGAGGNLNLMLDLTSMPTIPSQPVLSGQTWNFQCWYRDVQNQFPTSSFTNGVSVTFN